MKKLKKILQEALIENANLTEAEDYKYKKYVSKAFDKINDAMFEFRHAMGVKQLGQADPKIKKQLESLQQGIFNLQKEMRSQGLTEAKLNEAPVDMNDPFLVQTRIMRHAAKERKALDVILKAQPKVRQYKISFDKYLELLDQQMFFQQDLADIGKQIKQMWIDMEQEAEPEGGPIADRYGRDLMKLEADYKKVKAKLAKVDAQVDRHSRY